MSKDTDISWTHSTFNPWWGCVKVSPACTNCYAERDSNRFGFNIWGPNANRRFFGDKHWQEPIKWNAAAQKAGERHRVFCASMADVSELLPTQTADRVHAQFHLMKNARAKLVELIDLTPSLDWLLLTKRPENFFECFPAWKTAGCPDNVWFGVSVENQKYANERIPLLLQITARIRFLSCEPLLGAIDLKRWLVPEWTSETLPTKERGIGLPETTNYVRLSPCVDWVIAGGESGPNARPMHPDWVRSLRDQSRSVGVPFHFKQWGEWAPYPYNGARVLDYADVPFDESKRQHHRMVRIGKAKAGHLLDGKEHMEFPQ